MRNRMASVKFIASQPRSIYQYKNIRIKVLKCCADIFLNWQCLAKKNVTNYANKSVPVTVPASRITQNKIHKNFRLFKAYGTLHSNSMLIKIQPDATVCRYLFTAVTQHVSGSQHPSSGVLKTVTTATGTATSLQRGLIRSRWREVAVPVLWPVPEVAVTVFSTPDDGWCCEPETCSVTLQ